MQPKDSSVALGWQASPFTLPDAAGQQHSFESLIGPNGMVVVFICNHCPYVKAIGHRLSIDAQALHNFGVNLVAINSNDFIAYPADNPDNMLLFAEQYSFGFPYLVDEDQSVAKQYDALCTPDFFGLCKEGKLAYRGRLDDARMNSDTKNRTTDLLNAMSEIATTGVTKIEQVASMGCSIKWKAR